jgi:hypothetical protein
VNSCGLASKKTKRNKIKDCNCKYNPTAMLVVCGLQTCCCWCWCCWCCWGWK